MAVYTPGALSAIFDNSKCDKDDIQEQSNEKLVKLFSKTSSRTHDSLTNATKQETSNTVTDGQSSKKDKNRKKEKTKDNVTETTIEKDFNVIGPTVISSKDNSETISVSESSTRLDDDDEDIDQDKPKYTGPSRKFQVIAEDKKKHQFDDEQESRTIFVGNLPNNIQGKILKRKFREYGEIESVRIRSVARPDMTTTKKLAFIKQKFHESRNNVNAYIRFKDIESARQSCKLNGSELDSHVIRVDIAGKGKSGKDDTKIQEHDQTKAVFLGNVKFNEQEDNIRKHFEKCGKITDVRLVRDTATGMGKGFGYVNFDSSDAVIKAIKMNGSKLNDRSLRVTRAVNRPKKTVTLLEKKTKLGVFKPKTDNKGHKKKSFLKVSKEKQKRLTSQSYQGKQMNNSKENKEKKNKSKKKFNKNERRKSTISKKLSQPKKMKTPKS